MLLRLPKILPIILVVLVGALVRILFIAFSGPDDLVRIVPDDAFYYLKTAQNWALGNGPTFDGVNLTNGFHPLWMIILLPIASIAKDPLMVLKIALSISAILSVATSLMIIKLLRTILSETILICVVVGLYILNAQAVVSSLNGLETSLNTFIFSVLIYQAVVGEKNMFSVSKKAFLGLLMGLLLLARTDNIFFLLPIFLYDYWFNTTSSNRFIGSFLVTGTVGLITLPWIWWNLEHFGSIVQSSSQAVPYVLHANYASLKPGMIRQLMHSAGLVVSFITEGFYYMVGFSRIFYALTLSLLVTLYFLFHSRLNDLLQNKNETMSRNLSRLVIFLWVGGLGLVMAHVALRWYPRPWYFDQMILLTALTFGFLLKVLFKSGILPEFSSLRGSELSLVVFLIIIWSLLPIAVRLKIGEYPHQIEMLDAACWLKNNTSKNERAAAFNAGIISYFSERPVINLDGAINNSAFSAIKEKRLGNYLVDNKVKYYLDYEPAMEEMYKQFWFEKERMIDFVSVAVIDRPNVSWNHSSITVFSVE